jgi:CheY-like chemotaxis protein
MAKEKDYDLILMDLQMPVMDGLESARQILKFYDGKENVPKIIALTANVMKSDRQDCEEVGMVDFIPKPLQLASLGKVLEKWFGSNDHQPS